MRTASPSLALSLITLVSLSCSEPAQRLTLGPSVELRTETLPVEGGTITLEAPGPLEGLSLELPSGAYASPTAVVIGYQEVTGHALGAATPLSPLIHVETTQEGAHGAYAEAPMRLTVPITLPAGHFAMGFFYDAETDELEAMPLVALSDTSVTVLTRHFSDVLIAAIEQASLERGAIDTPFTLGVDDWQFENEGTVLHPKGDCAGMSISAMHYFRRRERDPAQPPLYERYDGVDGRATPGFDWDDADARRFVSVVQSLGYATNARLLWQVDLAGARPSLHYYALAFAMALTGQPQYISVRSGQSGHALVAYRIADGTDAAGDPIRRIEVYDSNYPYRSGATPHAAEYSMQREAFTPYRQPDESFPDVFFIGRSALVDWPAVEALWARLDDGTIGDDVFPSYSLVWGNLHEPSETGTVVRGQPIVTGASEIGVRLESTEFRARLSWFDDSGALISSSIETPPGFGYPLEMGTNHIGVRVQGFVDRDVEYVDFTWLEVERTEMTGPSRVVVPGYSGIHTITLTFPEGQGTGFTRVPESELGYSVYGNGTLVDVELGDYPSDHGEWPVEEVPVSVSIEGAMPLSWRIYSASNSSDPAARSITMWWEDTAEPIPMRADRFYWLYIYPETGPYYQEVIRLRGAAP